MRIVFLTVAALCGGTVGATPFPDAGTFTLYRNSMTDMAMRLHVATFDAAEGEAYNRENCAQAMRLFEGQLGVKTRFWCERGRFRAAHQGQEPVLSKQFTTGKTERQTCSLSVGELAKSGGGKGRQGDFNSPTKPHSTSATSRLLIFDHSVLS